MLEAHSYKEERIPRFRKVIHARTNVEKSPSFERTKNKKYVYRSVISLETPRTGMILVLFFAINFLADVAVSYPKRGFEHANSDAKTFNPRDSIIIKLRHA